ncbi:MAG: adenylate kinase family protein [Candidatus Gracilibacteria bacterium]
MDLLLFGIQGSGKGTQAGYLFDKYKFLRFGAGHELREVVRSGKDERADHIRKIMQEGRLVSDHIVFDILEEYLSKKAANLPVIFDGLPRNIEQLEMFLHIMEQKKREYVAVFFDISLLEALKRIKSRRECSECGHPQVFSDGDKCTKCAGELITRSDDQNESIIMERFQTFFDKTFPVIAKLSEKKKVTMINATVEPEQVFAQLDLILQQYHYKQNAD